jgi:hypothetical protein
MDKMDKENGFKILGIGRTVGGNFTINNTENSDHPGIEGDQIPRHGEPGYYVKMIQSFGASAVPIA